MHLRPNPALNAALRGLQASGVRLACWSPGPEEGTGSSSTTSASAAGRGRRRGRSADVAVRLARDLAASPDQAVVVSSDAAQLAAAAERGLRTATQAELDGRARAAVTR